MLLVKLLMFESKLFKLQNAKKVQIAFYKKLSLILYQIKEYINSNEIEKYIFLNRFL
jgi:hypothetical protein